MKTMKRWGPAVAATLALALPALAQIAIAPAGSLRVEGDSTLHKWSVAAKAVALSFKLADGAPPTLSEAITSSKVASMELTIAVADLKSGESGLDKNMRSAMNAGKFPDVAYRLDHYVLGTPAADGAMTAKTTGELTISGQTKTVTMDVEFRPGPDALEARGSYTLNMSDYGIKPPTLMLGAIKVRDPVTIRFDLILKAR